MMEWIKEIESFITVIGASGVGLSAIIYALKRRRNGGGLHKKLDKINVKIDCLDNRIKRIERVNHVKKNHKSTK